MKPNKYTENIGNHKTRLLLHNGPVIWTWKILEMYKNTIFQTLFQNVTGFFFPSPQ